MIQHKINLENAGIITVIICDAAAQIIPAMYTAFTKEEPLKWCRIAVKDLVCLPIYEGWCMPIRPSDNSSFKTDLMLQP